MPGTVIQDLLANQLIIGPVSKAARSEFYDSRGNNVNCKRTYCAATASGVGVQANNKPFFVLEGSATATIRVQWIRVSSPCASAVEYNAINIQKFSSAATGGTAVALTKVPLDSNDTASTANTCQVYTGSPSAGALVGNIVSERVLLQSTTANANGHPDKLVFDFRALGENNPLVLRGTSQGIGLNFTTAPGSSVDLGVEVMWTEE